MSLSPRLRITRHRRICAVSASAAIAVAVFLSGLVGLSQTPALLAAERAHAPGLSSVSSGPADVSPELAETFAAAEGGDAREPSAPTGDDESAESETGPDATSFPSDAAAEEAWFDPETGEAEIMVLFADAGVTPEAAGDQARAAAALREGADSALERARPALDALEREGRIEVLTDFWLLAGVLVRGEPSAETLDALASLPGAKNVVPNYEVVPLEEGPEPIAESPAPSGDGDSADGDGTPVTYGLDQIAAPDAWEEYDARGQGVRVAVLDTGVDPNHPDIADRLVTEDPHDPLYPGGWIHLDHLGQVQAKRPADPATHGTHVAGTVLGGDASGTRIGVAPEADLMAVNAISGGSSSAKVMKALEWALSPYDADGRPAGRAADVVNMSLGYDDPGFRDTTLLPVLERVRDAGTFPAVASGNDMRPDRECVSNPSSSYDAFAVGMTTETREVNADSCGGTTHWSPEIAEELGWPSGEFTKPDATAPGTSVYSAVPGGGWGNSTGTSMATPHVAGAVASLRSAQAGLSVDQIVDALERTAWHPDKESAGDAFAPDIRYGHGIIDLHAAIASVRGDSGITLDVTDEEGAPLPGVTVSWGERGETWRSDADGRVASHLGPGDYTLTLERFGYATTRAEATVAEGRFTELAVPLQRLETGTVTGTVTDESTERPLAGVTVSLVGEDRSVTTDARGAYRLEEVPAGEHRFRAALEGKHTATSETATVLAAADAPTRVDFTMSDLPRALVLGEATGRSAELLAGHDIVTTSSRTLPADLQTLADVDVVIWDDPGAVSAETLQRVIDVTDRAGTGVVWLDLGSSDTSGIAALAEHRKDPAQRHAFTGTDVTETGYRIWTREEHPVLASGDIYTGTLGYGSIVPQSTAPEGDRFYAAFSDLASPTAEVLAATRTLTPTANGVVPEEHGAGIAVDERAGNRHAYLALHGTHPAVDARSWSAQGQQIFVNAVGWAAGSDRNEPPKQPPPETPDPPVVTPGEGGNRGPGASGGAGGTSPTGGGGAPLAAASAPATSGAGGGQSGGSGGSSRAPAKQSVPKPEFTPDPPVAGENQLTAKNAGGVTVRVKDGIAFVKIPDSEPGDWFFLYVYPSRTAVDWIRVNDDGELRIDVSTLDDGTYRFAFTDPDEEFVGWVEVEIGSGADAESAGAGVNDPATAIPDAAVPGGLQLSTAELLMLLGAALLLLTAAGVVLLGLRAPAKPGGGVGPASGAVPA